MAKCLLIFFIFSGPKNFAIEVENYRLDYSQDDSENEDLISINQAFFWPNNSIQLASDFILSNKDRNLLNRFEIDSVYEFNLNS